MKKTRRPIGTKWWPLLGYSQAVARGTLVRVAATAVAEARDADIGQDPPYAQTERAIHDLEAALEALGAGLEHVIRTRIYVKDLVHWPSIARAYGEVFTEFSPQVSVLGARRLKCTESLVEIEADAFVLHEGLRDLGSGLRPQSARAREVD